MAYFHSIEPEQMVGSGIPEDKRLINSKTSWTLHSLPMEVLQYYASLDCIPPSMKEKLKEAMMIKQTKGKKGGLTGVSKKSGFIRRLMWENKHKHGNDYKNPTWGLHNDSNMSKKAKFEWKKLASKDQGGLNSSGNPYGASPFITKHFKGDPVKWSPGEKSGKESEAQKKARYEFMAKKLHSLAGTLHKEAKETVAEPKKEEEVKATETIPDELVNHFGNATKGMFFDNSPTLAGLEVTPIAKEEKAVPKNELVKPKEEDKTVIVEGKKDWESIWEEQKTDLDNPKWKPFRKFFKEYLADYTEEHGGLSEKETALWRFVVENPRGKLSDAIADLKKRNYTGLAPGTVSPLLKEMRNMVKNASVDWLDKLEDEAELAKRGEKISKVLKKHIPIRRAKKELKQLKEDKEERDYLKAEEDKVKAKEADKKAKEDQRKDNERYNFPVLSPTDKPMSSEAVKLNYPKSEWKYNLPKIKSDLTQAVKSEEWYEANGKKIPPPPFPFPNWHDRVGYGVKEKLAKYDEFTRELVNQDSHIAKLRLYNGFGSGESPFCRLKSVSPYGDKANICEKYDVAGLLEWLKEYINRGIAILRANGDNFDPYPKKAKEPEFPKEWTRRMEHIAIILRESPDDSLAKIATKLNKTYKDKGANGDLTKSAINKAVNTVKAWLKKAGQTGSDKPQTGAGKMCGV